jgi:hypothetical protein
VFRLPPAYGGDSEGLSARDFRPPTRFGGGPKGRFGGGRGDEARMFGGSSNLEAATGDAMAPGVGAPGTNMGIGADVTGRLFAQQLEAIKGRLMDRQAAFDTREEARREAFEARAAGMPNYENRLARYENRADQRAERFEGRMEDVRQRREAMREDAGERRRSARDLSRRFMARRGGSNAPGVTGASDGEMAPTA